MRTKGMKKENFGGHNLGLGSSSQTDEVERGKEILGLLLERLFVNGQLDSRIQQREATNGSLRFLDSVEKKKRAERL